MKSTLGNTGLRSGNATQCISNSWLDCLLLNFMKGSSWNIASRRDNGLWIAVSSLQLLSRKKVRLWVLIETLNGIFINLGWTLIQSIITVYPGSCGAVTVPWLCNGTLLLAALSTPRHIVENHSFLGNFILQTDPCIIFEVQSLNRLRVINCLQLRVQLNSGITCATHHCSLRK